MLKQRALAAQQPSNKQQFTLLGGRFNAQIGPGRFNAQQTVALAAHFYCKVRMLPQPFVVVGLVRLKGNPP